MKVYIGSRTDEVDCVRIFHKGTSDSKAFLLNSEAETEENKMEISVQDTIELDALIFMLNSFKNDFERKHGFVER